MKMTLKKMVAMGLHEEATFGEYSWSVRIRRVPGGWVYENEAPSVTFVPLPAGVEPVEGVDY